MKNLNIFQKFVVFLIDASTAFFIFQVVALILSPIYFLPFLPGYWAVWMFYYVVSYCFFRRTLGQSFFNAGIAVKDNKIPLVARIVLREILTSFPAIIFWTTFMKPIVIMLSLILLLLCIIILIFRNKLFGIRVVRYDSIPHYKSCWIYIAIILLGIFSRVINIAYTGDREAISQVLLNGEPRPHKRLVKNYADYIKANRQDINDYIMGLYKEYDHVILCERMHPEMTQYDMIYNLATDDRFVDSVGVVFTEIGNVDARESYRELVNKTFDNDTLLEKDLASFLINENQSVWLLWANTNWFNFLKKMYYFNHGKDNKVEIMFSDRNWLDRTQLNVRDSIMSDNIISTIEADSIKKSLVIMNYRHALKTKGNVGYYLNRKYPGKVANVMINTPYAAGVIMPVQDGRWDVASEQVRPVEYAFDFNGSPFGEDNFDFALFSSKVGVKYKDMFTGIIFYKTKNEQFSSDGFNFMFEPDNTSAIDKRSKILPIEAHNPYKFLQGGNRVRYGADYYGVFARVANILIIGVIFLSLLLGCAMSIYIYRRRKVLRA